MKVQQQIQAINEPFFTADGSSDSAQLLVAGSPMFEPSNVLISAIWQTDYQGMLQLSAQPRTLVAPHSQDVTGWAGLRVTPTNAPGIGPDGGQMVACPETTANGAHHPTAPTFNMVAGTIYTYTVVIKPFGGRLYFTISLGGNGFAVGAHVNVDLNAQTVQSFGLTGPATLTACPDGSYIVRAQALATVTQSVFGMDFYTCMDNSFSSASAQYTGVTTSGVNLRLMIEQGQWIGVYAPTTSAPATIVDYTSDQDEVDFGYTPVVGATFIASFTADIEVLDATATLLAQYANSPAIVALVDYMNQWIDPSAQLDQFYNMIWNVETAQGEGLDIWGTIVDIPRTIQLVPPDEYFGFETSVVSSFYPFNNRPFYSGPVHGEQFTLSDDAYRVLIMTKALANISSFTAPSLNALFRYLFAGRGSCYALDLGGMQMQYVFNFALQPWEASVLQQPQLMPRPSGVGVTITVNP